jgi:hypothetical protein
LQEAQPWGCVAETPSDTHRQQAAQPQQNADLVDAACRKRVISVGTEQRRLSSG